MIRLISQALSIAENWLWPKVPDITPAEYLERLRFWPEEEQ